jgi:hypothetical protein
MVLTAERTGGHEGPLISIKLRMAGISRRGEGGWDLDGWALVVARRSPLPGLGIAVLTCSPDKFPTRGRPQGPQPLPTPLPPLRETRRLTIFSFLFHLSLMPIGRPRGPPPGQTASPAPTIPRKDRPARMTKCYASRTDRILPDGSLNHAIFGPPPRAIPFLSVTSWPSL